MAVTVSLQPIKRLLKGIRTEVGISCSCFTKPFQQETQEVIRTDLSSQNIPMVQFSPQKTEDESRCS